ncbi:hypothetical protein J7W08_07970 [Methanococcoides orientis]|uniref:hypothetical protein n=1 Tax=Methanococcoides orientis TaxID=2822137 RepID=UPI001E2FA2C6|nr:hypothetical protein [Methanococcoides orientis]UGV40046.1 hypothetical protein J7W08_07970 [Methanococcoides orientis]
MTPSQFWSEEKLENCHMCDVELKIMRIADNAMYYCQKCGRTTSIDSACSVSDQIAYTA